MHKYTTVVMNCSFFSHCFFIPQRDFPSN